MITFFGWFLSEFVTQSGRIAAREAELKAKREELAALKKEQKALREEIKRLHDEEYLKNWPASTVTRSRERRFTRCRRERI